MDTSEFEFILKQGEGQFIKFKEKGFLKRIGSDKGGYWEIQ